MTIRMISVVLSLLFAPGVFADDAQKILESRLRAVTPVPKRLPMASPVNIHRRAQMLRTLNQASEATAPACQESRRLMLASRYVVSWDDQQKKACRISDLSFPTLIGARHRVAELPTEELKAADYLAWVDGRYDEVYSRLDLMRKNLDPQVAATASWVAKVKFRSTPDGLKAMSARAQGALPTSFRASDLEVGRFQISPVLRNSLKTLLAEARVTDGHRKSSRDPWEVFADDPQKFLEHIKFDWNDLRKVYDIALEGEFLPLVAPVTLVDFERPHKQAVEFIVRETVGQILRELVKLIPEPVTQNIVDIAVADAFEFIHLMYDDRYAQLEQVLRAESVRGAVEPLDVATAERGLDILFGTRSNLIMEFAMAAIEGRRIRWEEVDKLGRLARYRVEKSRDITMGKIHSKLVLDKKCETELMSKAFAICSKEGKKNAIYSLMSEHSVLFWNLGAPVVHRYDFASEVLLKRGTSWMLSVVARVYKLPWVGWLQEALANQLKGFAKSGMVDEAYLRADLLAQKRNVGSLNADSQRLLGWLYLQNINPFLPKSEASENAMIRRNGGL